MLLEVDEVPRLDSRGDTVGGLAELVGAGGVVQGLFHGDEFFVVEPEKTLVECHHADVAAVEDVIPKFHRLALVEHLLDDGRDDHDFRGRDPPLAAGEREKTLAG